MKTRSAVGFSVALCVPVAVFACSDLGGLSNGNELPLEDASTSDRTKPSDGANPNDAAVSCEEGKALCGALCSDLANDSQNCGRCGRDCLGAKCTQGACEPITLATGLNIPQGIAVDATDVYVAVYGSGDILRIPKAGGVPVVLDATAVAPWGIALELDGGGQATRVVWGTRGSTPTLTYCTLPQCVPPIKVNATYDVRYIAVANGVVYWTESTTNAGSVRKCALSTNCSLISTLSNEPQAEGLAVKDNVLLVARRQTTGSLRRMTTSGGGAIDLIPTLDNPTGVATDGTSVFVAVNTGSAIARCPLLGCNGPATFAFATNPHDVAVDAQNVYWGNGLANGGSVAYCPLTGCPDNKAKVLAPDQKNPYGIVVDDKAIYWTNSSVQGAVMKIAKP